MNPDQQSSNVEVRTPKPDEGLSSNYWTVFVAAVGGAFVGIVLITLGAIVRWNHVKRPNSAGETFDVGDAFFLITELWPIGGVLGGFVSTMVSLFFIRR